MGYADVGARPDENQPVNSREDQFSTEEDLVPSESECIELERAHARSEAINSPTNDQTRSAPSASGLSESALPDRGPINPVHIVLVKPIYPRNIGMCARAIANFGFQSLIVVAAQTEIGHEAKQGAAHAQRILRNARIYADRKSVV